MGRFKRKRQRTTEEEPVIVLDKSFVRAANGTQVRHIFDTYRVLMPEDLFFELIHSDEETMAKCFAKLPPKANPVGILPRGALIQHEVEYRQPSTPVWNHVKSIRYEFNDKLAAGEFELNLQHRAAISEWEEDLARRAAMFAERARLIINIFPVLAGYRPGQDRARIDEVLHDIATNVEGVRRFYAGVSPKGFPPASIVGRTWAVFRYMQVHLTADVEYLAKYGIDVHQPTQAKLENERVDLDYLMIATLARGLASHDTAMKRRFRSLCPKGTLIEVEKRVAPMGDVPS